MNTALTFLERNHQQVDIRRLNLPSRLSSVLITPRFRASRHVIFLVFAAGSSDPLLVVKLPRLAEVSDALQREAANLRAVHALRPGGFNSIPRVVVFGEDTGRPLLVETALVGQPMDRQTVRRDRTACCTIVMRWLAEVQCREQSVSEGDGAWFGRLVEQPLRHFTEAFPLTAAEERLLGRTWELVAPLADADLPLVFEHGDLSHPNVMLLRDGGVGVVDWEIAEPQGLPAYDLFFFLSYAAFAGNAVRTERDYVAAFHQAFFGRCAWSRHYVTEYAERLGLPKQWLTPIFILSWARYAANLLMRLGQDRGAPQRVGAETAEWLRTNRYYALWQHAVEHVHELDWSDIPRSRPTGK